MSEAMLETRKTFVVAWVIEGTTEIEADTAFEAEARFHQKSVEKLAPDGSLTSYSPVLKGDDAP